MLIQILFKVVIGNTAIKKGCVSMIIEQIVARCNISYSFLLHKWMAIAYLSIIKAKLK